MSWRERGVTIPVPGTDLVLEGLWQRGEAGGAVVAPPHPEFGGTLDNPVVNELAYGLYRCGLASLRFNWRGVGASQGSVSGDPASAVVDYRAALGHLRESVDGPLIGAGYSFGAAAAVRAALEEPGLRKLLLVAPPPALLEGVPIGRLDRPVRVIVGDRDRFAPPEALADLLASVPDTRIDVIEGADHFFFDRGLAEIQALAGSALR